MTLHEALADVHRRSCLVDRHDDACLALTAGFDELVEQRDRARRIAVALEQDLDISQQALNQTGSALFVAVEA